MMIMCLEVMLTITIVLFLSLKSTKMIDGAVVIDAKKEGPKQRNKNDSTSMRFLQEELSSSRQEQDKAEGSTDMLLPKLYPQYCSIPSEMEHRTIPKLNRTIVVLRNTATVHSEEKQYEESVLPEVVVSTNNANQTITNANSTSNVTSEVSETSTPTETSITATTMMTMTNANETKNQEEQQQSNVTATASHMDLFELESQVLHVSVFIRHGARTPYAPLTCWDNYHTKWDCQLTSLMAPSMNNNNSTPPPYLFEKIYDGLEEFEQDHADSSDSSSTSNSSVNNQLTKEPQNGLGGTCLTGQLIEAGFIQELHNGHHLRQAYIGSGSNDDIDSTSTTTTKLFNSSYFSDLPYPQAFYVRSDDEERTLMSAQVLMSGIFDMASSSLKDDEIVIIPLHTADYKRDIIAPRYDVCPLLQDITQEAYTSNEYLDYINSPKVQNLLQTAETKLHWPRTQMSAGIDCLMTTYCNQRFKTLPNEIWETYNDTAIHSSNRTNISDGITDNDGSLFDELYQFFVWNTTFDMYYDSARYSKLGMTPLWADVTDVLAKVIKQTSLDDMKQANLPLLSLYSGHDTTLLPILMSLDIWDSKWPPYASMITFETHILTNLDDLPVDAASHFPSGHAFRLMYNGEVLTHKLSFCGSSGSSGGVGALFELCDLQKFIDYIRRNGLANRQRDCTSPLQEAAKNHVPLMERTLSIESVLGLCITVAMLSAYMTYLVVQRYMMIRHPGGTLYENLDDSGGDVPDSTHSASLNGYLDTAVEVAGDSKASNDRAAAGGYGSTHNHRNGSSGEGAVTVHIGEMS